MLRFTQKIVLLSTLCFTLNTLLCGCMTSAREDQLQASIKQLQGQVGQLQTKLDSREQQITNTTKTALSSENDVQDVKNQLLLTQGAVDELKAHLQRIEQTAGATNNSGADQNAVALSANRDLLDHIQRQVAYLELATNARFASVRSEKLPAKIKTSAELNKALKHIFELGDFKKVLELASSVLRASSANEAMLQTALEYKAEAKFKLQDYKGAALDFSTYAEVYSGAPKYARALLLAGDSYVYLKNEQVAKSYYQECAQSYATSAEGKAAADRLASLAAQHATPAQAQQ